MGDMNGDNYRLAVATFIIWGGLCAWLLSRRAWKVTMRQLFVMVGSFAVIAALAAPTGQAFLRRHGEAFAGLVCVAFYFVSIAFVLIALHRTAK